MKYLIEKNTVFPVQKITDDIKEKSIKYSGFDFDGKEVEIYDLENGKLAPIVRYLIEGGEETRSKLLVWLMIGGLILLLILVAVFVGGDEEEKQKETVTQTNTFPINSKQTEDKKEEIKQKIEIPKENNIENELKNEVDMLVGLKNEAEKEALRVNLENDKKQIQIERINNKYEDIKEENQDLLQKNELLNQKIAKLEENLKNTKKRIIESPTDEFIYYLGDMTYKRCEDSLNEKILNNCKELYFNYLNYAEKEQ